MHVLLDTNIPLNMYLHGVVERSMPLESGKVLAAAADKRFTAYLTPTSYSNTFSFPEAPGPGRGQGAFAGTA